MENLGSFFSLFQHFSFFYLSLLSSSALYLFVYHSFTCSTPIFLKLKFLTEITTHFPVHCFIPSLSFMLRFMLSRLSLFVFFISSIRKFSYYSLTLSILYHKLISSSLFFRLCLSLSWNYVEQLSSLSLYLSSLSLFL